MFPAWQRAGKLIDDLDPVCGLALGRTGGVGVDGRLTGYLFIAVGVTRREEETMDWSWGRYKCLHGPFKLFFKRRCWVGLKVFCCYVLKDEELVSDECCRH